MTLKVYIFIYLHDKFDRYVLQTIIFKDNGRKTGWKVYAGFSISLHKKDQALLDMIKVSFGNVGYLAKHGENSVTSIGTITISEREGFAIYSVQS